MEPVTRNDTRWSSTHDMLLRFFRIREFLDDTGADLLYNMPTPIEVNELNLAMADLAEFDYPVWAPPLLGYSKMWV